MSNNMQHLQNQGTLIGCLRVYRCASILANSLNANLLFCHVPLMCRNRALPHLQAARPDDLDTHLCQQVLMSSSIHRPAHHIRTRP
jgi:hypothetical protein